MASRRVNSNDSFSFASSIKCCVGMQTKKKRQHHKGAVVVRSHSHSRRRHDERSKKAASDQQWVGLGSLRSAQPYALAHSHGGGYGGGGGARKSSPTHSTVSCPHMVALSTNAHRGSRNYSSGYSSEVESLRSTIVAADDDEGGGDNNSDSDDLSDFDFSRVAGARGKSGNNVMMKLAKKFSKKNFPIARDDDFLEGEWHLNQRSNSVSKLDTLEG